MSPNEPDPAEGPIPITASTEYTRAIASALIAMHGKKWGKRFVRELAKFLSSEETFTTPIRPAAGDAQAARVHHETMALFRGHLPAYLELIGL